VEDPRKLFKCELCIYSAFTKSKMSNHVIAVHFNKGRTRDYPCEICDKSFFEKYFLTTDFCRFGINLSYFYRSHLKTHRSIHFPRQFKCRVGSCKFEAALPSVLNRHKFMYHTKGSFNCNACDQNFTTKYELLM
jgi:hypothetical protein